MGHLNIGLIEVPGIVGVEDDGSTNGFCSFINNHFGRVYNVVFEKVRALTGSFNCTLKTFPEFGDYDIISGNYTSGITGAVQRGDIDYSLMPTYYPLKDQHESLSYSSPVYEDAITMSSFYNMTSTKGDSQDILFMFNSIPVDLWIGLSITFVVLVLLLQSSYKIHSKKPKNGFWIIFRAFLDDDMFDYDNMFEIVFGIFCSTTLFFAMSYLSNCVSTDLVVVGKPKTITSYDDILCNNATAMFNLGLPDYEKFKYEDSNSIYRKLWNLGDIFELTPASLPNHIVQLISQKQVLISREVMARGCGYLVISNLDSSMSNTRALLSQDKKYGRKFVNSFLFNSKKLNPASSDIKGVT